MVNDSSPDEAGDGSDDDGDEDDGGEDDDGGDDDEDLKLKRR